MKSPEWICKKNEIACHIRKLFEYYEEDKTYFDEYLDGVLKHDIDEALTCFRDLVSQLEWLPTKKRTNDAKAMPANQDPPAKGQFQSTFRRRA